MSRLGQCYCDRRTVFSSIGDLADSFAGKEALNKFVDLADSFAGKEALILGAPKTTSKIKLSD